MADKDKTIAALEADNAELREALTLLLKHGDIWPKGTAPEREDGLTMIEFARAALGMTPENHPQWNTQQEEIDRRTIQELSDEIERLREALEKIAEKGDVFIGGLGCREIARTALQKDEEE